MPEASHKISRPTQLSSCVVFASPHSGRDYTAKFLRQSQLDRWLIRSSEDAWIDQLFAVAPKLGAPLLLACAPRAYVDLNRSPDELDPAIIDGARKLGHNPRVASGLGVIPRVVAGGRPIYRGKLPMTEAQRRLNVVWHPYHDALRGLLREAHEHFGRAILVDCHSMPREALEGVTRGKPRPDVVLGDRFGSSADGEIMDVVEAAFSTAGFQVARNSPFAGAYVTQTYGRPSRRQHALQIEIDRSIYMDEATLRPSHDFEQTRTRLSQVIAEIVTYGRDHGRLAAE